MYCIDPSAEIPIMLINKHIGFDEEEGQGISGSLFQEELLRLDSMGKARIEVYINSVGGSVLEGYNICNAILKTKTPVDTYNVGMAASIAGVIFLMGRKRYAADYSIFMAHNPSGCDDEDFLQSIKDSLVKLVSANCSLDESKVSEIMEATTWMDAQECLAAGIATQIEVTSDQNKKHAPKPNEAKARWKEYSTIVNSIFDKKPNMNKVTNILKLTDGSNEDAIVSAITDITNKLNSANEVVNATKAEKDALKKKLDDAEDAYNKMKAEYDKMKNDMDEAEDALNAEKCSNMVKGYAKAGRIKNEAAVIDKWVALAKNDFEGTEVLIKELPLNKAGVIIPETVDNKSGGDLSKPANVATYMAKLRNKQNAK
jgi:ATP-dependent Clp protease protease subunit